MKDSLSLFDLDPNLDETKALLNTVAEGLFTACVTLNERPYVRYQGESGHSRIVADRFMEMYDSLEESKFKEPRATLLIMDRSFDLCAPFQHSFTYQSLVADLKGITDRNEISVKSKEEVKEE